MTITTTPRPGLRAGDTLTEAQKAAVREYAATLARATQRPADKRGEEAPPRAAVPYIIGGGLLGAAIATIGAR